MQSIQKQSTPNSQLSTKPTITYPKLLQMLLLCAAAPATSARLTNLPTRDLRQISSDLSHNSCQGIFLKTGSQCNNVTVAGDFNLGLQATAFNVQTGGDLDIALKGFIEDATVANNADLGVNTKLVNAQMTSVKLEVGAQASNLLLKGGDLFMGPGATLNNASLEVPSITLESGAKAANISGSGSELTMRAGTRLTQAQLNGRLGLGAGTIAELPQTQLIFANAALGFCINLATVEPQILTDAGVKIQPGSIEFPAGFAIEIIDNQPQARQGLTTAELDNVQLAGVCYQSPETDVTNQLPKNPSETQPSTEPEISEPEISEPEISEPETTTKPLTEPTPDEDNATQPKQFTSMVLMLACSYLLANPRG